MEDLSDKCDKEKQKKKHSLKIKEQMDNKSRSFVVVVYLSFTNVIT